LELGRNYWSLALIFGRQKLNFLRKHHSRLMIRLFKSIAKFVIVMFVMTIVCTVVWQEVVAEYLYDNTDENMMGFIHPFYLDGWIGQVNFPVVAVQHVVHGRSMSDPDEIKEGWSISKLWCLWFSFVAVSLVISVMLARVPWIPRRQLETEPT
jgi:hypothetical protein